VICVHLCRRKRKDYHIFCTLGVMATLSRQLGDAGIGSEDVKNEIVDSDCGVQAVTLTVSPEQQARLDALTAGPPDAAAAPLRTRPSRPSRPFDG
jgi:hypothetical protein